MDAYFEKKLVELLPPLYRERDETGDLESFLKVPAATLDELKELMDRLPELFDVERCEHRWLPYLGEVVGHRFDPRGDADRQRRQIREAIEIYRHKGTLPALGRALIDLEWRGRIEETYRQALRLNRRSVVGRAKLPGTIFSLGAYRVESDHVVPGLRDGLRFHHPTGTRAFFRQWLILLLSLELGAEPLTARQIQRVCFGQVHETFVVGRNALNSDYHLTRRVKTWDRWSITSATALLQEIERAGVALRRWETRTPRFRVNTGALNDERLPNLWASERKLAVSCGIETRPHEGPSATVIRLSGQRLNRARLDRSTPACTVEFRKKDHYAPAQAGFEAAANLFTATRWPTTA